MTSEMPNSERDDEQEAQIIQGFKESELALVSCLPDKLYNGISASTTDAPFALDSLSFCIGQMSKI